MPGTSIWRSGDILFLGRELAFLKVPPSLLFSIHDVEIWCCELAKLRGRRNATRQLQKGLPVHGCVVAATIGSGVRKRSQRIMPARDRKNIKFMRKCGLRWFWLLDCAGRACSIVQRGMVAPGPAAPRSVAFRGEPRPCRGSLSSLLEKSPDIGFSDPGVGEWLLDVARCALLQQRRTSRTPVGSRALPVRRTCSRRRISRGSRNQVSLRRSHQNWAVL